jgi:hypothetical protein
VHLSQQTTLAGMKKRKNEEEGVRQKKYEEIDLKTCLHRTKYIKS